MYCTTRDGIFIFHQKATRTRTRAGFYLVIGLQFHLRLLCFALICFDSIFFFSQKKPREKKKNAVGVGRSYVDFAQFAKVYLLCTIIRYEPTILRIMYLITYAYIQIYRIVPFLQKKKKGGGGYHHQIQMMNLTLIHEMRQKAELS